MLGAEKDNRIVAAQVVRSAYYGGVENHVHSILKNIDRKRYRVILISLADFPISKQFEELGIEIIKLKDRVDSSAAALMNIVPLVKVLRRIKPDIVHLHGVRPIFIGGMAAKITGVRAIVSTLHGSHRLMSMDARGRLNPIRLGLSKLMHLIGFSLSTIIIADAENLKEEIQELFRLVPFFKESALSGKLFTIYNGVDVGQFYRLESQTSLRKKLGIDDHTAVIGTVSRLDEPKKGIAVFLRAVDLLLKKGYDAHFIITGEGYSKSELIHLANELAIKERVHFLGHWENLLEVFVTLDIFVLPSLSEGFPIVNLEAMAAGLPVVSSDVGGVAEGILQNHNGIVVSPKNERQFASALGFLIDHPEIARQMGRNGKKRVEAEFTTSIMTEKIFTLYDRALKTA